jgi:hypothetical protein
MPARLDALDNQGVDTGCGPGGSLAGRGNGHPDFGTRIVEPFDLIPGGTAEREWHDRDALLDHERQFVFVWVVIVARFARFDPVSRSLFAKLGRVTIELVRIGGGSRGREYVHAHGTCGQAAQLGDIRAYGLDRLVSGGQEAQTARFCDGSGKRGCRWPSSEWRLHDRTLELVDDGTAHRQLHEFPNHAIGGKVG